MGQKEFLNANSTHISTVQNLDSLIIGIQPPRKGIPGKIELPLTPGANRLWSKPRAEEISAIFSRMRNLRLHEPRAVRDGSIKRNPQDRDVEYGFLLF